MEVCALEGFLGASFKELEKTPGWHVLPNGLAAYSDPVATQLLDPSGTFEWKARMTFMKTKDGKWMQVENVSDYTELGNMAFRRFGPTEDPQRTITVVAPTKMKDYFEVDSEVPVTPFPTTFRGLQSDELGWSDEEVGVGNEEMMREAPAEGHEDEAAAEERAGQRKEVEMDAIRYSLYNSLKELREGCERHGLPTSGSKSKLLMRLDNFRMDLEAKMQTEIARKLHCEKERKPVSLGIPKRPSLEQQNEHNLTHYPFAGWCQACTRAKEEVHRRDARKDVESNKTVISFDFGYTYVDDYGNERSPEEVRDADDQYGTVLYIADHHTKAVHAVPVLSKGAPNLKLMVEELVRFGMQVAGGDPVIYQSDGERSTKQLLRAVQHCRANQGLETEIRISGVQQHASNGQAERTVQSVRRLANCLRYYAEEQAQVTILGNSHVYPWSFRHASWLINRYRVLEKERRTSFEVWSGRRYQGKICLFGESVMYGHLTAFKGEPRFGRGIWVGKSPWTDCHIVLTPRSAVESKTVKRIPDQFIGTDLVIVKGLPWN